MKHALAFDDVLLVPHHSIVASRDDVSLATTVCGLPLSRPFLSANMAAVSGETMVRAMYKAGGLGVLDRTTIPLHIVSDIIREAKRDKLDAVASIGSGDIADADYLYDQGVRFMCIDVAHGHHEKVISKAQELIGKYDDLRLIVGNIATAPAANHIMSAIFSSNPCTQHNLSRIALKIGVGSGSLCSTRIVTGFGVPTFQSVLDVAAEMENLNYNSVSLIADGGIRTSGDVVKCLAAGADAVMLGSLLAGTDEAPGDVIKDAAGNMCKVYRGSASFAVKKEHKGEARYIEGAETLVPYKGHVAPILRGLAEGIRSGLSYNGSLTIEELQTYHEFIQVSAAGSLESSPHLLRS